ncbi:MAG: hypothetical protein FWG03_08855, partial [Clostridiales bacterium]|nr:hypothetical protein [Clostridiales bacterium]
MKTRNRIWSAVLTLSLVCSLFIMAPAAAFGAEGQEEGDEGWIASSGPEGADPPRNDNEKNPEGMEGPEGVDPPRNDNEKNPEGAEGSEGGLLPRDAEGGVPYEGEPIVPLDAEDEPIVPLGAEDEPIVPLAVEDVGTAAELKAALAANKEEIKLELPPGQTTLNYNEGIVINGRSITIYLNGFNLKITNTKGPGLTLLNNADMHLLDSGIVTVTGKDYGVRLDNESCLRRSGFTPPTINVTATAKNSTGVYAGAKSQADVDDVTAKASGSTGVYAAGRSNIAVNNITSAGIGIVAQSRAEALIKGDISAGTRGISAMGTGTEVRADGNVKATASNGIGAYAGAGSMVMAAGTRVSATGTGGVGARADGGEIFINEGIWAAGTGAIATAGGEITCGSIAGKTGGTSKPSAFIKIGNKTKKPADTVLTTKAGYKTYTDGTSTVWVGDAKKQGWGTVGDSGALIDVLEFTQTKGHAHEGSGIVLNASIITHEPLIIHNNSDVLIDLNGYDLTCDELIIENGSLSLTGKIGEGTGYGYDGFFTVTKSITLDKGVLITPGYGGQPRVDVAAGSSTTPEDIILAENGSFVDIKGLLETYTNGTNGINARSASTVKLEGSVLAYYNGVRADGKGTVVDVTGDVISTGLGEPDSAGVRAEDYAKVTVGGDVNGNSGDGIQASGGANVTLTSGGIPISAAEKGIYALNPGTTVKVQGGIGTPGFFPEYAVYAVDGAFVSVDASMASGGSGTVTGTEYGAYAEGSGTFVYIKPGATGSLHARDDGGCIAFAEEGGEIHVAGDLSTGTTGNYTGAKVYSGGTITIDGKITVSSGVYTVVDSGVKNIGNKTEPTTKPGYFTYSDEDTGSTVWVNANYVCRIGDEYYESLQDAINAIPSGETGTITLLKDPEIYNDVLYGSAIRVQQKTVTIDLSGFNLTAINDNGGYGLRLEGATLILDNSGSGGKRADIRGNTGIMLQGSSGRDSNLLLSERFQAGCNTLDAAGDYRGLSVSEGCVATITSAMVSGTGINYGVTATGSGASATVFGDVTVTGDTASWGANASGGARVTVGGDAIGVGYGAHAGGSGSMVTIGGSAIADGPTISFGAVAENGAVVIVGGDAVSLGTEGYGAEANQGGTVEVGGNAGGRYRGVSAYSTVTETSVISVRGMVVSGYTGAYAGMNSIVTVGGAIIQYPYSTTSSGVTAQQGGQAFVKGDIVTDSPIPTSYGTSADSGGKITV